MKPFLTCSSPPHPLHRSAIRSSHRQYHCRPIWAIYAVLKPSLVRQVARVAQSRTVVDLPLLHGPHRASPPCPTSTAKPLPRFVNLPDRFLEPPTSERVRSRASAPGAASAGQNPLPGSSTWPTAAWS